MCRHACDLHLNTAAQGCGEPLAVDSEMGAKVSMQQLLALSSSLGPTGPATSVLQL